MPTVLLVAFTFATLPVAGHVSVFDETAVWSAWVAPESPAAQSRFAQSRREGNQMRFQGMDRNNDGRITRDEWNGSNRSFRNHDWNGDGVLSGDEVRVGTARHQPSLREQDFDPSDPDRFNHWTDESFSALDHNRDGRIVPNEWHYDTEVFNRVDENGDGALTRSEFVARDADDGRDDRFDDLDVNGNGRIEEREWLASLDTFDRLDRNNDNVLTRAELGGTRGRRTNADRFASLDVNGDNKLTPDEWHFSRASFDARDLDRDGAITRSEMTGTAEAATAPTSGQMVRVGSSQEWIDTGIDVRAGDMITFNAEGTLTLSTDTSDVSTPAGAKSGRKADNAPMKQHPAGALIGRIGNSGPILIGQNRTIRAPIAGRLFLGINDDHLPDNQGDYQVTINVRSR
jgi:Ca2+-binding EF-hand superfamily protein